MKAYQHITDRIIRAIETERLVPRKKPRRTDSPRNVRGNVYRSINRLVLSIQPYAEARWLTSKQVSDLVKKWGPARCASAIRRPSFACKKIAG